MFKGHIKEGTLVLCDGLKSYLALEKDTGCSVKDVTKERSGKFFNLNTVNNFHSFIKGILWQGSPLIRIKDKCLIQFRYPAKADPCFLQQAMQA